jgi:hypothetical protein
MTHKNSWPKLSAIGFVIAVCTLSACGSSSNDNPTPSDSGTGGKKSTSKGTGGKGAAGMSATATGGKSGSAGAAGEGKAGGGAGVEGTAGMGGSAGSGATACEKKGTDKCYTCDAPASDEQFLNRCTSATCTAYDNSKLTKIVNGKLPSLPN